MIGRGQRIISFRPPNAATRSGPGESSRWNVLPSTISKPSASTSRGSSVFTAPRVASGTNAGVCTVPWARCSTPVRARPSAAWVRISNIAAELMRSPARLGPGQSRSQPK